MGFGCCRRSKMEQHQRSMMNNAIKQQGTTCTFTLHRNMWKVIAVLLALLASTAQPVAGKTLRYQMFEEQRVGTVIARLREDAADVLAKLPPSGTGAALRFRAMQRSGSAALLAVREQDGEITVRTKIDREKLCSERNALNCSIQFDVLTLPTEHLQLFHIEVDILDINDNTPQFARAVIPIEISESAAVGARIPLDSATDPDVGDNALRTYALEAPGDAPFRIDVQARPDGAKYAELVVLRELDRETRAAYELKYTATDGGAPPRTGSTLLRISVSDSNDNSPVFDEPSYVVELPESSPVGTLVVDLNATDADEGTNGKIVYSFSSHVSPKIMETFRIHPDSGRLTLVRRVDYETQATYDIDVQAQDMGPNSMPAHCKIQVKVVDVNDNKPDISINLMSSGAAAAGKEDAAYISEASPPDTFVALVRVEDADSGLNGEVVCKLHGQGYFKLQKSYENNYMILTNGSLDREKRSEFSLTVVAEDRGAASLSTVKHFTVHVTDENDNAPRFDKARYEVFKSENNAPGAYLTSLVASDPDLDVNGQVSYSIVENTIHGSSISTYVTVDPSNGAIYALRTFDREDVSRISFVVQAKDAGVPPLQSNATVVLNILDENDNAPQIVVPQLWNFTADVPVSRFTEAGGLVTAVRATDRDTGVNAELFCAIAAGNDDGFFVMDARSCEVRANASLAAFPRDRVDLTVVVRDGGTPESLSARALLKVALYENMENHVQVMSDQEGDESALDASLVIIISLGAVCATLLVIMVVFAARCSRDKKRDPRHSYNCRVAESSHTHHPRKPSRQVHKGDITLVPTVNGTLPVARAHHHRSPSSTPPMERRGGPGGGGGHAGGSMMGSLQRGGHGGGGGGGGQSRHQSLNSLVTISSNHIPESFALELAHATPPVEQVSQLLSMLHQGQYQPRPSFRGNKYSRSYRYALQDMDKFSLKDSGRGDSEAGDSDYDMGRESPVDSRLLLGDGCFSDLMHLEMHHRLHPAMRLCTDECRVLGHSDQCWMPPLASPSCDYRNNMYIPGEEGGGGGGSSSSTNSSTQQQQHQHQHPHPHHHALHQHQQHHPRTPEDDRDSLDSQERDRKSFSTFGKMEPGVGSSEELGVALGHDAAAAAGPGGGGVSSSLLTEMNSVFQRLLPPPPNMDSYGECDETSSAEQGNGNGCGNGSGSNVGSGNNNNNVALPQQQQQQQQQQQDNNSRNKGLFLPGGKGTLVVPAHHASAVGVTAAYPPGGVAAWAASTHYLNPMGNPVGSVGAGHVVVASSPNAAAVPPAPPSSANNGQQPQQAPPPPHLKWLPAMEEIPENYEEDEFDGVFHHAAGAGTVGGAKQQRSNSIEGGGGGGGGRNEVGMDASELVNEINKLLQDVRQS